MNLVRGRLEEGEIKIPLSKLVSLGSAPQHPLSLQDSPSLVNLVRTGRIALCLQLFRLSRLRGTGTLGCCGPCSTKPLPKRLGMVRRKNSQGHSQKGKQSRSRNRSPSHRQAMLRLRPKARPNRRPRQSRKKTQDRDWCFKRWRGRRGWRRRRRWSGGWGGGRRWSLGPVEFGWVDATSFKGSWWIFECVWRVLAVAALWSTQIFDAAGKMRSSEIWAEFSVTCIPWHGATSLLSQSCCPKLLDPKDFGPQRFLYHQLAWVFSGGKMPNISKRFRLRPSSGSCWKACQLLCWWRSTKSCSTVILGLLFSVAWWQDFCSKTSGVRRLMWGIE